MGVGGMLWISHLVVNAFREVISVCNWVPLLPDILERNKLTPIGELEPQERKNNTHKRNNSG